MLDQFFVGQSKIKNAKKKKSFQYIDFDNFDDKIKLLLYLPLRNSTTYLTLKYYDSPLTRVI